MRALDGRHGRAGGVGKRDMNDTAPSASLDFLCRVDITLDKDAPLALGRSPWRNRRVSHIAGGTIEGERLKGEVVAGGGDWSEGAADAQGDILTLVDVRSLWRTADGADIYVAYAGRLIVPAAIVPAFRDPSLVDAIDPARYYFRIVPTFETAAPQYDWLNRTVAVGVGARTSRGARYDIHLVR